LIRRKKISWKIEKEYLAAGNMNIVGIDEAGRGPLAGPVVAAAVLLSLDRKLPRNCFKFNDSKNSPAKNAKNYMKLSAKTQLHEESASSPLRK